MFISNATDDSFESFESLLSALNDDSLFTLEATLEFLDWIDSLRKNGNLVRKIYDRLGRMADGHLGDVKPVGGYVSEARVFGNPALRIYYTTWNKTIIILLIGGGKGSQDNDIKKAKAIAARELAKKKTIRKAENDRY